MFSPMVENTRNMSKSRFNYTGYLVLNIDDDGQEFYRGRDHVFSFRANSGAGSRIWAEARPGSSNLKQQGGEAAIEDSVLGSCRVT